MPISIGKNTSRNPRAERELMQPIDNSKWKDWSEIMEESGQVRVNFANLEGDFPKPSSHAPDRGVIQHYYHLDADERWRPKHTAEIRGVLTQTSVAEYAGTLRNRQSSFNSTYTAYAPWNNNWRSGIILDDYRRDMQEEGLQEQGTMLITIAPAGAYGNTKQNLDFDGISRLEGTQILVVDYLPIEISFTTNANWAQRGGIRSVVRDSDEATIKFPNIIYVPPGGKIYIDYNLQEDTEEETPNEDKTYLSPSDSDASWELGTPVDVEAVEGSDPTTYTTEARLNDDEEPDFTWKPLESPASQPAKIWVAYTNYQITEAPYFGRFGNTNASSLNKLTDTHLFDKPKVKFDFDELENNIQGLLDTPESEFTYQKRIMGAPNRYPVNIGLTSAGPFVKSSPDPKHFWSAGALGYLLYLSGVRALRTQSALDYAMYGNEVNWRSWKNVRKNDIAVFKFKNSSGGHVGFIRDVDLGNNKIKIAGGNQSNKFKETEYRITSVDMYLLTIRRNWSDPGDAYRLI